MKAAFLLSFFLLAPACSDSDGAPLADAQIVVDADPNAPDADPNAVLPFMSECEVANDLCDSSIDEFCFAFNKMGPHCTHDCTDASMCESPSRGCNNRGVCKSP